MKDAQQGDKVVAPKTLEDAMSKLNDLSQTVEKLSGQLKETTEESIKRKEKLRTLEQEKENASAKALKEQEKFKELAESLEPKAKRADELEKALKGYFDLEVADVPEDKRTLIPSGPVEVQLSWLKTAKAQGIFTGGATKPPAGSAQGKPNDPNTPEFLSYTPSDPRLLHLSRDQYAQWQKHHGRNVTAVGSGNNPVGWGSLRH